MRATFIVTTWDKVTIFQWKSPTSPRPKKEDKTVKCQKSVFIIFYDINVIVYKKFIAAGQIQSVIVGVEGSTVTFCSNCVNICEDVTLNFGNKRTACCIPTHDCHPPPPTLLAGLGPFSLFCFPGLDQVESYQFDMVKTMQAEIQVVLEPLTEYDFLGCI